MTSDVYPIYRRLSPEIAQQLGRSQAKATRAQSALEYTLFVFFGLTIVIAAVALIITNTSAHKRVPNRVAAGMKADRVNIVLMETVANTRTNAPHAHALLLLSVKPSTGETALASIPRDLWVRLGNYGTRRLSAAPAVGRATGYPGEGAGLTADTISEIIGEPVHAYVRLDIGQLIAAIDAVGGIDVDVKQPFYEYRTKQRFRRGMHHFDGKTAFRYASSHAVMGPANDRFAREARQQQVIAALLARLSDPAIAARLETNVPAGATNLTSDQVGWVAQQVARREPRTLTLAPYFEEVSISTVTESGEVVQPRGGDFRTLQRFVENIFAPATVAAR
jgi:LCP family protein required for cell wall assembly